MIPDVIIVAIDGPSGVGKSTVARAVARRLGLPYLETGAMYRALGWKIFQGNIDPEDQPKVEGVAADLDLALRDTADQNVEILLDGSPLDARVRLPEVSKITSLTSSYAAVRHRMVALQRQFAESHGVVMEGRDIGSRVFPDTPHKFFLTAPLEIRVERRIRQLEQAGETGLSVDEISAEVAERDARDTQRRESPLTLNTSYTVVDTGVLSAEESVDLIVERVESSTRFPVGGC